MAVSRIPDISKCELVVVPTRRTPFIIWGDENVSIEDKLRGLLAREGTKQFRFLTGDDKARDYAAYKLAEREAPHLLQHHTWA